jgi:hypothetical protein
LNQPTFHKIDSLRRKVTAENGQVGVVVELQDGEDSVADAAPELKNRSSGGIGKFRKFGEKPISIFEEPVLKFLYLAKSFLPLHSQT